MRHIIIYCIALVTLLVAKPVVVHAYAPIPPQTYKSVHNPRQQSAVSNQQSAVSNQKQQTQKPQQTQPKQVQQVQQTEVSRQQSAVSKEKVQQLEVKSEEPKVKSQENSWLNRFYKRSGYGSLSFLTLGYMYSCMGGDHIVTASVVDFRVALFSASLLNMELAVSPFTKHFSYKPNLRVYVPIAPWLSLVPYAGAEVDGSYICTYIDKAFTYDAGNEFYVNAVAGVAFNLTAARTVPIEIKAEYRHPVYVPEGGVRNPQGVYVGLQVYLTTVFDKRK